jgi:hypothetical protein
MYEYIGIHDVTVLFFGQPRVPDQIPPDVLESIRCVLSRQKDCSDRRDAATLDIVRFYAQNYYKRNHRQLGFLDQGLAVLPLFSPILAASFWECPASRCGSERTSQMVTAKQTGES